MVERPRLLLQLLKSHPRITPSMNGREHWAKYTVPLLQLLSLLPLLMCCPPANTTFLGRHTEHKEAVACPATACTTKYAPKSFPKHVQ